MEGFPCHIIHLLSGFRSLLYCTRHCSCWIHHLLQILSFANCILYHHSSWVGWEVAVCTSCAKIYTNANWTISSQHDTLSELMQCHPSRPGSLSAEGRLSVQQTVTPADTLTASDFRSNRSRSKCQWINSSKDHLWWCCAYILSCCVLTNCCRSLDLFWPTLPWAIPMNLIEGIISVTIQLKTLTFVTSCYIQQQRSSFCS